MSTRLSELPRCARRKESKPRCLRFAAPTTTCAPTNVNCAASVCSANRTTPEQPAPPRTSRLNSQKVAAWDLSHASCLPQYSVELTTRRTSPRRVPSRPAQTTFSARRCPHLPGASASSASPGSRVHERLGLARTRTIRRFQGSRYQSESQLSDPADRIQSNR